MGSQIVGEKLRRRVEAAVGVPVLRAWSHGHASILAFVTDQHRHGVWDRRDGVVEWDDNDGEPIAHYASCRDLFPGWQPTIPRPTIAG